MDCHLSLSPSTFAIQDSEELVNDDSLAYLQWTLTKCDSPILQQRDGVRVPEVLALEKRKGPSGSYNSTTDDGHEIHQGRRSISYLVEISHYN